MSKRRKHTDAEIRAALAENPVAGEVAAQLHEPLPRVIRLQNGRFTRPLVPVRVRIQQVHTMQQKLADPAYGRYWRELQGLEPVRRPQPRRVARMVADDRCDEEISFETVMGAVVGAIVAEGRRGEGRGAA